MNSLQGRRELCPDKAGGHLQLFWILQLNWGLSSDVPDTVRLDPAGTASPLSGETIFTKALAY